jgi:hypothetical protein
LLKTFLALSATALKNHSLAIEARKALTKGFVLSPKLFSLARKALEQTTKNFHCMNISYL